MSKRYVPASPISQDAAVGYSGNENNVSFVGGPSALAYAVIGLSQDQTSFSTGGKVLFDTYYQLNGGKIRLTENGSGVNTIVVDSGYYELTFLPMGECASAGGVGFRTVYTVPSTVIVGEVYVGNHEGTGSGDLHYTTGHGYIGGCSDLQVVTLGSGSTLPTTLYGGRQGTLLIIQEITTNHRWWGKGFVISSPAVGTNIGASAQSSYTRPTSGNDISYNSGTRAWTLASGKTYFVCASASMVASSASTAFLASDIQNNTTSVSLSRRNLCLNAASTSNSYCPMNRVATIVRSSGTSGTIIDNDIKAVTSVTSTGSTNITQTTVREIEESQAWFHGIFTGSEFNQSFGTYVNWWNLITSSKSDGDGSGKISVDYTNAASILTLKGGATYRVYGGITVNSSSLRTRWVVKDLYTGYEYSQRALCKPVNTTATDGKFAQPYVDCIIPATRDTKIVLQYVAEDGGLTSAALLGTAYFHFLVVEVGTGIETSQNIYIPNVFTGTSFTMGIAVYDSNIALDFPSGKKKLLRFNNASPITVNIQTSANRYVPVGSYADIMQYGTGQVTIVPAGGVTVNSSSSLSTRTQYSVIRLTNLGIDEWLVTGDMA